MTQSGGDRNIGGAPSPLGKQHIVLDSTPQGTPSGACLLRRTWLNALAFCGILLQAAQQMSAVVVALGPSRELGGGGALAHSVHHIAEILTLRQVPGATWKAAVAVVAWVQLCSLGLVVGQRHPRESLCRRPVYVALATALGQQGSASIVLGLLEALRCRCDAYAGMPWSTDNLQWCSSKLGTEQMCWVPGSINVHMLAVYTVLLFMYVLTTMPNLWARLEWEAFGTDEVDTGLDLRDPPLYANGASLLQFLLLLICTLAAPMSGAALLPSAVTFFAAVACMWTWQFSQRPGCHDGCREWDVTPLAFGDLRVVLNLMVLYTAGISWAVCSQGMFPQSEYYSMLLRGWAGLAVLGVMAAGKNYATRTQIRRIMWDRGWEKAAASLVTLQKKLRYINLAEGPTSTETTAGPSSEVQPRTFSARCEISEADGALQFDALDARQLMRYLIEWEEGIAVEWLNLDFVNNRAAWVSKLYQEISAFSYPPLSNRIDELCNSIQPPPTFKQIALALYESTPLPGHVVEVIAALAAPECALIRRVVQLYLPRPMMNGIGSVDNDATPGKDEEEVDRSIHTPTTTLDVQEWRTLGHQAGIDTFWAHLMTHSLFVKEAFLDEIGHANGFGREKLSG